MPVQQIVSPVDGSVYAERTTVTPDELQSVLASAEAARAGWRDTPLARRVEIVEAMVQHMESVADDIAVELAHQMGRPVAYGGNEIRRGYQERARHMASIAAERLADIPVDSPAGFHKFLRRDPLGSVLVVAPWNYPYLCAVNSIVPALLAGNTIVLKHATQTLLCAERMSEGFAAAGLPEGVFQHVVATHDDVATMIADPRIDFVVFTGSVEGGHVIQRRAGERFIGTGARARRQGPVVRAGRLRPRVHDRRERRRFVLQLRPVVLRDRADLRPLGRLRRVRRGLRRGHPRLRARQPARPATTIGPMVTARAAEGARAQVAAAIAQGARALVSEADFPASAPGTPYMGPTVLVDVDHSMDVMTEEPFGPVIGIMKVSSDEEAVRLMNDSKYGLTASIWTSDPEAMIAIGDRIETGTST